MQKKLLDKKNVVITGASNGIGNYLANKFIKKNYNVINIDIQKSKDKNIDNFIFDLKNTKKLNFLVSQILHKYKKIDLLINNARSGLRKSFLQETNVNWENVIDVNLKAHFFLVQTFLKNKNKKDYLAIINISSVAADLVTLESGSYHLSKAALDMMTKYFAYNSVNLNVSIFSFRLGMIIQKRYFKKFNSKKNKVFRKNVKIYQNNGPIGTEEDIFSTIEILMNKELRFLTGNILNITGGSTLAEQLALLIRKNK